MEASVSNLRICSCLSANAKEKKEEKVNEFASLLLPVRQRRECLKENFCLFPFIIFFLYYIITTNTLTTATTRTRACVRACSFLLCVYVCV
jgi:hypothetical protein